MIKEVQQDLIEINLEQQSLIIKSPITLYFKFLHCRMAGLLSKFRIDYSDLKIIPDVNKQPSDGTKSFFDKVVTGIKKDGTGNSNNYFSL